MAGIQIESLEDLLSLFSLAQTEPEIWDMVDKKGVKVFVPVAVCGSGYDGRMGLPAAKLMCDLEKQMHAIWKEQGLRFPSKSQASLRVKVEKGSDLNWFDLSPYVLEAMKLMSPGQITLFLVGILCALGVGAYWIYGKIDKNRTEVSLKRLQAELDTQVKMRQIEHEENLIALLAKSPDQILENGKKSVQSVSEDMLAHNQDPALPVRRFAKALRKKDAIRIGEGSASLPKDDFLGILPSKRPDETVYHVSADGLYFLSGLLLQTGNQGFNLSQGDKVVTALLRMDEKSRKEILRAVDESTANNRTVQRNLHVEVYFTAQKIQHAILLGEGTPRKEKRHYSLSEIPNDVPPSQRKLQGQE